PFIVVGMDGMVFPRTAPVPANVVAPEPLARVDEIPTGDEMKSPFKGDPTQSGGHSLDRVDRASAPFLPGDPSVVALEVAKLPGGRHVTEVQHLPDEEESSRPAEVARARLGDSPERRPRRTLVRAFRE